MCRRARLGRDAGRPARRDAERLDHVLDRRGRAHVVRAVSRVEHHALRVALRLLLVVLVVDLADDLQKRAAATTPTRQPTAGMARTMWWWLGS
jgi:hypothetical protein